MLADSQGNGVSLLGFKGGGLRHLTACKILKPPLYKLHLTPFPEGEPQLFLSTLLSYSIGCAEGRQQGNATAEGGFLVAGLAMDGQAGSEGVCPEQVAFALVNSIAIVAAVLTVEHGTLCEGGHA